MYRTINLSTEHYTQRISGVLRLLYGNFLLTGTVHVHYSTVHCSTSTCTVQCSTLQYNVFIVHIHVHTLKYSTVQYAVVFIVHVLVHYSTVHCSTVHVQYSAVHCSQYSTYMYKKKLAFHSSVHARHTNSHANIINNSYIICAIIN